MSDSTDPGGLAPERYGELLAHVLHFSNDERGEVLARLGEDVDAFEESHRAWQEALIAEAMQQESTLAVSYAVPFSATKKRLKAERPTLESLGALPTQPDASGEVDAAADGPSAPDAVRSAPVDAGQESATPVDVVRGPSVGEVLTGTGAAAEASPAPPPAAEESPAPPQAEPVDARMTGDLPANFLAAAALPFLEGQVSAPAEGEATEADSLKAERTERLRVDPPSATGTELAFRSPFAGMSLPWEEAPAPPHATVALDVQEMQRALAGQHAEPESSLTVEQYASFVVECRVYAERLPHVYRRYGIADADAAAKLDALFGRRFASDAVLRKRFLSLESEYLEWLTQNRPR